MTRIRIALAGLIGAALLLALPATAGTNATRLTATVGPGFTITLKKGTTRVTRLKAGTYTIVVRDRSADHNFRLRGGALNKATGVAFVGTRTWTVRLRAGITYRYVCDPHASTMRGSVRVVA